VVIVDLQAFSLLRGGSAVVARANPDLSKLVSIGFQTGVR
jgi:hypothetical protein